MPKDRVQRDPDAHNGVRANHRLRLYLLLLDHTRPHVAAQHVLLNFCVRQVSRVHDTEPFLALLSSNKHALNSYHTTPQIADHTVHTYNRRHSHNRPKRSRKLACLLACQSSTTSSLSAYQERPARPRKHFRSQSRSWNIPSSLLKAEDSRHLVVW